MESGGSEPSGAAAAESSVKAAGSRRGEARSELGDGEDGRIRLGGVGRGQIRGGGGGILGDRAHAWWLEEAEETMAATSSTSTSRRRPDEIWLEEAAGDSCVGAPARSGRRWPPPGSGAHSSRGRRQRRPAVTGSGRSGSRSRKYVSYFRECRSGTLGSLLDTTEFIWRCILRKQLEKAFAVILGCMSAAILLAEATLLPSGVDLSLFSILIKSVGKQEILVQVAAFVPLMYMCICTYYSLFKIGMLMFYSLTPRQTSSVSLLMICSMVARYAPPISYNFLNLIRLGGNAKTTFEKRMGNIDDAVPFFGRGFNRIYPLIMVVYTLLVASNFFGRVIDFFGSWKRFKFQREEGDMDGFDSSGMIILQKERSWIEQGCKVGEQVIPLARNFNGANTDIESGKVENTVEMKAGATSSRVDGRVGQSKYANSRETISNKYSSIREQSRAVKPVKKEISSTSVSLLEEGNSEQRSNAGLPPGSSAGISQTWASMRIGFQNFKANMGSKKFIPLRQDPGFAPHSNVSSPESLDEIFQRLKRHPAHIPVDYLDDDDNTGDMDPTFP